MKKLREGIKAKVVAKVKKIVKARRLENPNAPKTAWQR